MAVMRVALTDQNGGRKWANIDTSAPINQIRDAVVANRSLPVRDSQGRRMIYHLALNGRQLQDSDTLASVGATEGSTIQVLPEIVAGAVELHPLIEILPDEEPDPLVADIPLLPQAPVRVSVSPKLLQSVERHACSRPFQEVGGVLLGSVTVRDNEYVVTVTTHLRARHTRATAASLTFTGRTWIDIFQRQAAHPHEIMVGWYHSHPSYGIFLSSLDKFTHIHFFTDTPWKLALVVDPLRREWGFFAFTDGRFERCTVIS